MKLVLAAAMWNHPHLLVLDEPTNYLDREALGAFATAIKEFGGGVIMISHNREFYEELCNEFWFVQDGQVLVEGGAEEKELKAGGAGLKKKAREMARAGGVEAATAMAEKKEADKGAGCTNKTISKEELNLVNPKTFKPFSKKELRKLEKSSTKAGISLAEYVKGITRESPEWKWL